jgi:fructose-bisphosphate aldolase class II
MLMNMTEILSVAEEQKFAVPAFNIGSGVILNGVMDTCERLNAPVILAIHPKEMNFMGESFLEMCKDRAMRSHIPVCIHLDHSDYLPVTKAIRAGFTSVMIDASHLSFEENIAITKKVCELAHPLGISVEAELGTIGALENNMEGGGEIIYTNPEDAVRFVQETGCDTLAVAIGTSHGLYPAGMMPELKQELLSEIKSKVSVPLVLHGGSSNKDSEIQEAIKRGITKINISSDIKVALYRQLRKTLEDPKLREPFDLYPESVAAMNAVVEEKVRLFFADNKAGFYRLDKLS